MLDIIALVLLFFVALTLFYGVIAVHDVPYEIAKKRNHPHQDAIHVAGWISLLTLHLLWPFLWIWATLYRPDRGWGMMAHVEDDVRLKSVADNTRMEALEARIASLEGQLAEARQPAVHKGDK